MVVFFSNHCPLCNRLTEVLDNAKVDYKEVNDVEAMISLGIDRTPMLEVDTVVDGEPKTIMLKYKDALAWVAEQRGIYGQG